MPTLKTTVAWCRFCEHWLPQEETGEICPSEDCGFKLIKRVGYICLLPAYLEYECSIIHWRVRDLNACGHLIF